MSIRRPCSKTLADLQRAYVNFFEKRARFPRFKSRKRDRARFRIPQRVRIADGRVYVPKVGSVGIRQSQPVDGETKSATFKRDATGKWDVTLGERVHHAGYGLARRRSRSRDWH
jgi:putative transposase